MSTILSRISHYSLIIFGFNIRNTHLLTGMFTQHIIIIIIIIIISGVRNVIKKKPRRF